MNKVFNASAGTGKTFQVTRLYERLVVDEGADPRAILLMTFTDNAANELRLRVEQRLHHTLREADKAGDGTLSERIRLALARLPAAPIGTIHSFCTRLLREHALEAGLSPGFTVLEGEERSALLEQISRDALIDRLETDPDFRTFCAGAPIMGGFGAGVAETVPDLLGQAASLGVSIEDAEALLPGPDAAVSLADFARMLERLLALPKPTDSARTVIECLQSHLPAAESGAEALAERLLAADLPKFGRGKGQKPLSDEFHALLDGAAEAARYRARHPAARAFARFAQSAAREYRRRKHAMDAVDFDDQLRLAAGLLRAGKAAPLFRHVIVDEVQDTSRLQCEIIRALWGEGTGLVVCGDRKQSIYAWRGADPQVMPDLAGAILAAGGAEETLQTSYRSKPQILDVVNTLFASVYGPEGYGATERLESDFETPDEKPCVEFLAFDGDPELGLADKVAAEMEAVANRIRLLVEGPRDWQPAYRFAGAGFRPTGGDNPYRYSDILILLRRTKHQPVLEAALRHAGVPYTLGGKGRGLFTRQETRDVSLFLNVLANPQDAWSLVGFLRSPWIGLSDEAIAELAWDGGGFSGAALAARLAGDNAADEEARPRVALARRILAEYRALAGARLASELVRRLIEETGYDALLAGLPRGTQRLANLRKVVDWLRDAERGARTTPFAAARKLARMIESPPDIPEAALPDPSSNAVTIMTVHGAKGLTKHVVFLPDTGFGPGQDSGFARIFRDKQGHPSLGIRVAAPDTSSAASPGFKESAARAAAVAEHERNNLLYVAMTRARDLVVASASYGKRATGWLKDLQPFIGSLLPAIPYSALREAVGAPALAAPAIPAPERLAAAMAVLPPPPPPPVLRRIAATRLAQEMDEPDPPEDDGHGAPAHRSADQAAALGSLGHAVLEQLAHSGWDGSLSRWLDTLRNDFGVGRAAAQSLLSRLEAACRLMREATALLGDVRPEFPFVLHEGDLLVDGTIDLLGRGPDGAVVFDYKFTEADDASVVLQYRAQMEIYAKAAGRAFPEARAADVRIVVVSTSGPRIVPLLFQQEGT